MRTLSEIYSKVRGALLGPRRAPKPQHVTTWEHRPLDKWMKSEAHGWSGPEAAARFEAGARGEDFLELLTLGSRLTKDPAATELLALLERTNLRHAVLLDYGCGNALYKELLAAWELTRGWVYVGADVNPAMIESCRQRYPGGRFEVVVDGEPLPFQDRSFDLVLASGVLEFAEMPGALLREFGRVTRSWVLLCRIAAGTTRPSSIYAQTVRHRWGVEEHSLHVFNKGEIETLMKDAGFEIVRCEVSPANGVLTWVAPDEPPIEHFSYLLRRK